MEIISITNPDERALKEIYRSLPRRVEVMVNIPASKTDQALVAMEAAGFIAMNVMAINSGSESLNITAHKGKSGPCYNTGRHASYLGAALAALDDDNHILLAGIKAPVCEKTANIYKLPVYEKLLHCSDADQQLLAKLDDEPVEFNCSTLGEDLERLYDMLRSVDKADEFEYAFYPGPFRMVILNDGTIIKRGQVNAISKKEVASLQKKDNIRIVKSVQTIPPLRFQELYPVYGAKSILNITSSGTISAERGQINFKGLNDIPPELKARLLDLIDKDRKFFVLSGTDLNIRYGCCPSTEVTGANRLVDAGILDSFQQPAADDACPVTIYAFRNEITSKDDNLQFEINRKFRNIISGKIRNNYYVRLKPVFRSILLTFIFLALVLALIRISGLHNGNDNMDLYTQLDPLSSDQKMILLFHTAQRCEQCINMEKYINELLDESYSNFVEDRRLQFKMLEMDDPAHRNLVESFGLYTASVVLVGFKDMQATNTIVLRDVWSYIHDGTLFKSKLKPGLDTLLSEPDE